MVNECSKVYAASIRFGVELNINHDDHLNVVLVARVEVEVVVCCGWKVVRRSRWS